MLVEKVEEDIASVEKLDPKAGKFMSKQLLLIVAAMLVFILSFPLGRFSVPPWQLIQILAAKVFPIAHTWPSTMDIVVFHVRLPRILAAMLIGAALSTSGAAYQGMFRNPLVSSDILGASFGAGFGAALGILFSFSIIGIELTSFVFGLLAVAITYSMANRIRHDPMLVLVLTGVLVGTLFNSLTSLIKYVADPFNKLPAITYWLMGSLAAITPQDVFTCMIPMLLGGIPLLILRWRLNVLSLGEEEAKAMGLQTGVLRLIVITCATLMTAAAVSVSGLIVWVGLLVPHLARMIVGPNYKVLMPASMLLGSIFLLLVDDLARCAFSVEIPIGILTSMIGAPFFIYLLASRRRGWG